MWLARDDLLNGLSKHNIDGAVDTTKDEYQELIQTERSWWRLLGEFKIEKFVTGLELEIPKEFGTRLASSCTMNHTQAGSEDEDGM
jgi:hypothetical protein